MTDARTQPPTDKKSDQTEHKLTLPQNARLLFSIDDFIKPPSDNFFVSSWSDTGDYLFNDLYKAPSVLIINKKTGAFKETKITGLMDESKTYLQSSMILRPNRHARIMCQNTDDDQTITRTSIYDFSTDTGHVFQHPIASPYPWDIHRWHDKQEEYFLQATHSPPAYHVFNLTTGQQQTFSAPDSSKKKFLNNSFYPINPQQVAHLHRGRFARKSELQLYQTVPDSKSSKASLQFSHTLTTVSEKWQTFKFHSNSNGQLSLVSAEVYGKTRFFKPTDEKQFRLVRINEFEQLQKREMSYSDFQFACDISNLFFYFHDHQTKQHGVMRFDYGTCQMTPVFTLAESQPTARYSVTTDGTLTAICMKKIFVIDHHVVEHQEWRAKRFAALTQLFPPQLPAPLARLILGYADPHIPRRAIELSLHLPSALSEPMIAYAKTLHVGAQLGTHKNAQLKKANLELLASTLNAHADKTYQEVCQLAEEKNPAVFKTKRMAKFCNLLLTLDEKPKHGNKTNATLRDEQKLFGKSKAKKADKAKEPAGTLRFAHPT